MSLYRSTTEPRRSWFTVTPHDRYRFDGGLQDRFEAPKASIQFSSAGTCIYGLKTKPCLRVLRTEFERRAAQENARQEDRTHTKPGGRRHNAQRDYLLHMDAESRGDRSFEQVVARSILRCQHSQRASWARGESPDSPLRHPWREHQRPATAPSSPMRQAPYERPGTGRLFAPAGMVAATSLDMEHTPAAADTHPRHAARVAFEAGHGASEQQKGRRLNGFVRARPDTRVLIGAHHAAEDALLRDWPHGLPTSMLRTARSEGLDVGPLGFGIAAKGYRTSMLTDQKGKMSQRMLSAAYR